MMIKRNSWFSRRGAPLRSGALLRQALWCVAVARAGHNALIDDTCLCGRHRRRRALVYCPLNSVLMRVYGNA